jgi:hypothetical protein
MLRFRQGTASRPQTVLCGTVVLFFGIQAALGVFLTRVRPEVRDPEFGSLYQALRDRLAEAPGHPLVLLLGSSRSANIFRPSPPGEGTGAGPDPVVFNFATLYSGPVRELQMLRRLLARGVRPHRVVAEVWTPFLTERKGFNEEAYIAGRDLQPADGPLLAHYFAAPWPAMRKLMAGMLVPAFSYRSHLLAACSPFPHRPPPRLQGDWSHPALRAVEGFGWLPIPDPRPDPELRRAHIPGYAACIRDLLTDFRISPVADRALRELLRTCAEHGIHTAFVLLPEHSSLRACIPPEVEVRVQAYLADLSREHEVPVIDTRDWLDDDDFFDSRHALPNVAGPFTERFSREVLQPLEQGRPLPRSLLLGDTCSPVQPSPAHGSERQTSG